MALEDEIKRAAVEEEQSRAKYDTMAADAEMMGHYNMAEMMREMAHDERRHAQMMRSMMSGGMKGKGNPGGGMGGMMGGMSDEEMQKRMKEGGMMGGMMGSGMMSSKGGQRPFPKTYGDWVVLAEDIKGKISPDAWYTVNNVLQVISEGEEGSPAVEESRRWLMRKAAKLGIS